MSLKQLKYLIALYEESHFGRAAERCHVTQSTLSLQISKLEDYLGVPLFVVSMVDSILQDARTGA